MRKIALLFLFALSLSVASMHSLSAQGSVEAMGGLRIDRNPAGFALAGAGSSSTAFNMAYAAFSNPAASAFVPKRVEAAVSYASWAPSYLTSRNFAAGVTGRPVESLSLSVGFARQGYDPLAEGASFAPSDLLLGAGAGFAFSSSWSAGLTVNYMKQSLLEDYSLTGLGVSVLVQYHASDFNVAAGIVDLGGKVQSESGSSYSLPTSLKLAADYTLTFGKHSLQLALDGDYFFSGNYAAALGLDLNLGGIGHFRSGYRFASPFAVLPSGLGLGAGLSLYGVTLDLGYMTASKTLSGTWMAGLGYRF